MTILENYAFRRSLMIMRYIAMADVTEEGGEINRNNISVFCCDYISLSFSFCTKCHKRILNWDCILNASDFGRKIVKTRHISALMTIEPIQGC